jgi:hypothetical protein
MCAAAGVCMLCAVALKPKNSSHEHRTGCKRLPSLTAAARSRRCMLQGLPSNHMDATPTCSTQVMLASFGDGLERRHG